MLAYPFKALQDTHRSTDKFTLSNLDSSYHQFRKRKFVKRDVVHAVYLSLSAAGEYERLFDLERMERTPSIQAWYDNPAGEEGKKFHHLKLAPFKREWEELEADARQKDKGKEKDKRRNSRHCSPSIDNSSDDEEVGHSRKRTRKD